MSTSSTTNAPPPGASGATSADAQSEPPSADKAQKNKNRQGQQSKQKKAEQHRLKKGIEWTRNKDQRIRDKYPPVLEPLPAVITELRAQETTITKPVRQVEITTGYFNRLVLSAIRTLYSACKIPPAQVPDPEQYDLQTVIWVTKLQIEAKFFFGSLGSPFLLDLAYQQHGEFLRVSSLLPTALLPIAAGIDQIGRCIIDGQTIIGKPGPRTMHVSNEDDPLLKCDEVTHMFRGEDTEGLYDTGRLALYNGVLTPLFFVPHVDVDTLYNHLVLVQHEGQVLFNPGVYFQLDMGTQTQLGSLRPVRVRAIEPPLETLAARYTEFISRVTKKLNDQVFAPLELEKGTGTAAQLVGVECPAGGRALTYCAREASSTDHIMSAYYLLGYNTGHIFHDDDIALQSASVEIAAVPELLSSLLVKRLR